MKDKRARPARDVFSVVKEKTGYDNSTGEIVSHVEESHVVTKRSYDGVLTFTKMFYTDLFRIYGLSKGAMVVFIEIGGMMRETDNNIIITSIERQEISKRTGLGIQAIYNATRELVSSGLLKRVVTNVYMVDPNIFAVGNDVRIMANRREFAQLKAIDMKVRYTDAGREISVSVEKD